MRRQRGAPRRREAWPISHLYTAPAPSICRTSRPSNCALLSRSGGSGRCGAIRQRGPGSGVWPPAGRTRPTHPDIRLRFETASTAGAGEPLPAGIVRIYTRDGDGQAAAARRGPHSPYRRRREGDGCRPARPSTSRSPAARPTITRRAARQRVRKRLEDRNSQRQTGRVTVAVKVVRDRSGRPEVLVESWAHARKRRTSGLASGVSAGQGSTELPYRVRGPAVA